MCDRQRRFEGTDWLIQPTHAIDSSAVGIGGRSSIRRNVKAEAGSLLNGTIDRTPTNHFPTPTAHAVDRWIHAIYVEA